jgi:trehalose 6-phosphate synthase
MPKRFRKKLNGNDLNSEIQRQEFPDWNIIIASNRGPIENVADQQGNIIQQKGSGGLITGLSGVIKFIDATWISCAQTPQDTNFGEGYASLFSDENDIHLNYISVDPRTYDDYYNVIANPLIWFLQHSMWDVSSEPVINYRTWKAWKEGYLAINRQFADEIVKQIKKLEGPTLVMLQDYHLYMAAKYIRELSSSITQPTLLHFIHIPWPGPEYWYILPPEMRCAILESLCGVDLLGFQTEKDGLNFIRTVESHLPEASVSYKHMRIWFKNHACYIDDFPISIDVDGLTAMVRKEAVIEHKRLLEETIADKKVILRVDRIDPSKNIVRGFQAYQEMLTLHPEHQERVIFLAMLVPSRRGIDEYQDYLDKIMAISGNINADFGNKNWEPIRILVGEDYERALAAMQLYDVLLINAIADGMNLVAKEGPTVNTRNGVLILSEGTGASLQLAPGSTIISPCDIYATAEAMHQGLSMEPEQKEKRAMTLKWIIKQYDINRWFSEQIEALIDLNLNE